MKNKKLIERWEPLLMAGDSLSKNKHNESSKLFEDIQIFIDENPDITNIMPAMIIISTIRSILSDCDFQYVSYEVPYIKIGNRENYKFIDKVFD